MRILRAIEEIGKNLTNTILNTQSSETEEPGAANISQSHGGHKTPLKDKTNEQMINDEPTS